jgi:hypothetical protein
MPGPGFSALGRGSKSAQTRQFVLPADPLEFDQPEDPVVLISHRQLSRVVLVAAETGARFARERSPHDPAAWMCAPRRLFDGSNAMTACADRDMFIRALVLHGVSPTLDMEPSEMDGLIGDVRERPVAGTRRGGNVPAESSAGSVKHMGAKALFTATVVYETPAGVCHIFYAAIASDEEAVREQLRERLGGHISYMADVGLGFDGSTTIALSLVSEAMADMLRQIEAAPDSPLSAGFNLLVEHRFDD